MTTFIMPAAALTRSWQKSTGTFEPKSGVLGGWTIESANSLRPQNRHRWDKAAFAFRIRAGDRSFFAYLD